MSLRGFGYVEKLNKLNQNFDVNFVLAYEYLDHKKAKYMNLSRKYHCCVICEGNECNNSYSWCCKFSRLHELAFGSQLHQYLQNSYSEILS